MSSFSKKGAWIFHSFTTNFDTAQRAMIISNPNNAIKNSTMCMNIMWMMCCMQSSMCLA